MSEVDIPFDPDNPRPLITKFSSLHPEVPELQFIRDDPEGVEFIQTKNNYSNYAYVVRSKCGKFSVFLKHGIGHMKVDPGQSLPLERRQVEYDTLNLIHAMKPGACPAPYCLDMDLNIVAMEDLSNMKLFYELTQEHRVDIEGIRRLSHILVKIHKTTMKACITTDQWNSLKKKFDQPKVFSQIMDFYILKGVDPNSHTVETFEEMGPAMQDFFTNESLMKKARAFHTKAKEQECLILADGHQLSVFISEERVTVFDLEFCVLSQRSFNLAVVIGQYVITAMILDHLPNKKEILVNFKDASEEFLNVYISGMPDLKDDRVRGIFISDIAAYLAIVTMRTINLFGIGKFFNASNKQRARIIRLCTQVFAMQEKITTIDLIGEYFFPDIY